MSPDRFVASRTLIEEQIDAGVLGKPGLVRIHRWAGDPDDQPLLRDVDPAVGDEKFGREVGIGSRDHGQR